MGWSEGAATRVELKRIIRIQLFRNGMRDTEQKRPYKKLRAETGKHHTKDG